MWAKAAPTLGGATDYSSSLRKKILLAGVAAEESRLVPVKGYQNAVLHAIVKFTPCNGVQEEGGEPYDKANRITKWHEPKVSDRSRLV